MNFPCFPLPEQPDPMDFTLPPIRRCHGFPNTQYQLIPIRAAKTAGAKRKDPKIGIAGGEGF